MEKKVIEGICKKYLKWNDKDVLVPPLGGFISTYLTFAFLNVYNKVSAAIEANVQTASNMWIGI